MNDQDYIKLVRENGAGTLNITVNGIVHPILTISEEELIAFAKEAEARVLEDASKRIAILPWRTDFLANVIYVVKKMIAERRGE